MALNKIHVAVTNYARPELDIYFPIDTSRCGRCGETVIDEGYITLCDKCGNEFMEQEDRG
jgi:ribosomal protein S27AE